MRAAVVYVRVSTEQQGKSGLGIEAQRGAIARFAAEPASNWSPSTSRSRPARAPMRWSAGRSSPRRCRRAKAEVPGRGGEAGSAEPRCALHPRPDGAAGAVHRRRAGRRRRSVHAAHLRRPGREGAGPDLGPHPGRAGAEKARGAVLGNRTNLAEARGRPRGAGAAGRPVRRQRAAADRGHAPAGGGTAPRDRCALTARGVRAPAAASGRPSRSSACSTVQGETG